MNNARAADARPPNILVQLLPNTLSFARLLVAFAFPFVPASWRLPLVLAGGASDYADGVISRRFHATTTLGRLVDPVADKAFVFMVIGTLLFEGVLRPWEFVLLALRDILVIGGALCIALYSRDLTSGRLTPRLPGKATTAMQFVYLVALLWTGESWLVLLIPTALLSLVAGVDYLRILLTTWRKRVEEGAPPAYPEPEGGRCGNE